MTLNLAATFAGPIDDNDVHNGVVGIQYTAPSPLVGNRVFGNTTGVVMPVNSLADGLGYYPGSGRNEIYGNTTGVNQTGRMRNQWVRNNTTGVTGSGVLGPETLDDANLIEANAVGADFTGVVQFNRFARNAVGIAATDRQIIHHNLVYRGTGAGVKTRGADDVHVVHNTFYTTAGSGVLVDGGSERAEVLNNIFQADAGYNYFVADDSRVGFFSDYNDLYSTGAGKIARYAGDDYTDILALQQELNLLDLHSIGSSAASPAFAAPRFADLANDDYRTAGLSAGQRASSPTIDTAGPAVDVPAPPGFRNLLANPSFESGTGSWAVNVGGGTKNSAPNPCAFGGAQYFYAGPVAAGFAEQAVNLLAAGFTATQLDSRTLAAIFGGRLRSAAAELPADDGRLVVTFLDGSGAAIGSPTTLGSGNVDDRWELLGGRVRLPAGTRSVRYRFEATRRTGMTNDAFFDGATLDVRPDTAAPDMGAYGGNAVTDIDQAAAHIQIVAPDLYVDWVLTAPHQIRWQTIGNATGSSVKIDLYQDGATGPQFLRAITASTPDTGSFTFIPEAYGLIAGTRGLRVRVALASDPLAADTSSETFAIPEASNLLYVNDDSTAGDEYTTAPGDPATPDAAQPQLAPTVTGASQYASGGTLLVRSNNTSVNYTLPFAFPFYDASYTTVAVSTEGLLQFAGPDFAGTFNNTEAEFLRNRRVAPLWDDINVFGAADGVFVDASVAGQVKFTWKGVNQANGQPVNVSAVLFGDGRVRFDYGAGNTGLTPTVGVSMGDGRHFALVGGYNGAAALTNAASVEFNLVPGATDVGAYEFRGSGNDVTPPTITATTPTGVGGGTSVPGGASRIVLTFSEPLINVDARAAANYQLVGAGPDGAFGGGDDVTHALRPLYVPGSNQVTLELTDGGALPARCRPTTRSYSARLSGVPCWPR